MARVLSVRGLRFLGRISFGAYLWHYPIFWIVSSAGVAQLTGPEAIAAASLSIAAGWASHEFVEKRFR